MSSDHSASMSNELENLSGLLGDGYRVLVAGSTDSVVNEVTLQLLAHVGNGLDESVIVTTARSAATTRESYAAIAERGGCPALRIVDTLSSEQSVAALYTDSPTVYVPSPIDIERLVLGVSDITDETPPATGRRHLVVRTLTPILESIPVETVIRMIDRIGGVRSPDGLSVFGCTYTSHSEADMQQLATRVDGILWIEETATGDLTFELDHQNRGR